MYCPDCNKFVPYDESEPEVQSLDLDPEGNVTTDVRVVLVCGECSGELKEANFSCDDNAPAKNLEEHNGYKHPEFKYLENFEVEEGDVEFTTRTKGKGRWTETFYGFTLDYSVKCNECEDTVYEGTISDDIKASHMDELI